MYQWRKMKNYEEIDYGRRMSKEMNIPFIQDVNLKEKDLIHPSKLICNQDELHIGLDYKLGQAIELLQKSDTKSYFQFNGLMYCKLYPRYRGHQDEIVVLDLYWADILD